jgi:hypothetical protein
MKLIRTPTYENDCLLGYSAMLSHWNRPNFQRCILPPSPRRRVTDIIMNQWLYKLPSLMSNYGKSIDQNMTESPGRTNKNYVRWVDCSKQYKNWLLKSKFHHT